MEETANTAVWVKNLSPEVTKQTLLDFFSFCGEISAIKMRPMTTETTLPPGGAAGDPNASGALEALVVFQSQAAKKTALVLDSATLKKRKISVSDANEEVLASFREVQDLEVSSGAAEASETATARQARLQSLREEFDRALRRTSDRLSDFNEKHRISERVQEFGDLTKQKTQEINEQYRISERAREGWHSVREKTRQLDERFRLSESARDGWNSLKDSFGKIMYKNRNETTDRA
jgi:RNA recognition motif-containing protein